MYMLVKDIGTDGLMSSPRHSEKFCMICLDSSEDCKLYPVSKCNLDLEYERLTGISLQDEMQFDPQFCTECSQRLSNCSTFRNKSLRAYHLLWGLIEKHKMITLQIIKSIDRTGNKLASNIVKKLYLPDHYDFHLTDIEDKRNAHENNLNITERNYFENKDSVKDVKCKIELLDSDIYDDVIDISKDVNNEHDIHIINGFKNDTDSTYDDDIDISEDVNNEHNIYAVNDFKNDMDCDIDIDEHDETDYINYGMGTLASETHIEKERKINKTQLTIHNNDRKNKTNINTVKESEKQVNSTKLIFVKKKPVKKINEGNQRKVILKRVMKRVRTKTRYSGGRRFVPSTKLKLKLCIETELTQEQQKAEIMKRKESDNFKHSWFKCPICYKGFNCLEPYNSHMDKHTDKFGIFECDVCRIRCKNKNALRVHLQRHRFIYKCTKCPFVSTNRNVAKLHQRWHDGKIYNCTHCDQKFSKYSSMMTHVRLKHPSDYVCSQCGFSFIGEWGLQSHMDKKHRLEDTQNLAGPLCEPCNIRFASEEAYTHHMQASPKHVPVGQLKPNCRKQSQIPKRDDIPIDCEQCGMKLKGIRKYATHFIKEHPGKTCAQFPPRNLVSKERKTTIICEKCGKLFTAPAFFRQHMQVHTGVKLYKCEICDKGFSSDVNRKMHVRRHSGGTSFPCGVCHKEFSYESNQRRHMLLHKDTRPIFQCKDCGKTFKSMGGHDLHVKHVHLNVPWPKRVRGKRRAERSQSVGTSEPQH